MTSLLATMTANSMTWSHWNLDTSQLCYVCDHHLLAMPLLCLRRAYNPVLAEHPDTEPLPLTEHGTVMPC